MKINFGKEDKQNTREVIKGSFEDMLKKRQAELGNLQESIQKILGDYSGTSIAVVVVNEDENGDPSGREVFLGGVCTTASQIYLARSLKESADRIQDELMEQAKENPEQAADVLLNLLKDIANRKEK